MNLATDTSFFSDMALPDAEFRAKAAAALLMQRAPVGPASVPTVGNRHAAPIVAANSNMRARAFKRSGPSGATRMFNRAHVPASGNRRMATSFLMGASTRPTRMGTPVVTPLSLLQARVAPQKFARRTERDRIALQKTALQNWAAMRARASMVFGIIANRTQNYTVDMRDGQADTALAASVQARHWAQGLRYV